MSNRVAILLERIDQLRTDIRSLQNNKRYAQKAVLLGNMLKVAVEKLNKFGSRYTIVRVTAMTPDGEMVEIYYTDITTMEAIEYVKMRSATPLTNIQAMEIPSGKPLKF
jgi:hypothetical protein